MKVIVKTASGRPIRSSTALVNSAARALSVSRNRWRLMTSISSSSRFPISRPYAPQSRLEVDLLVVLIVSPDDHLHQLMADDITFVEVDESDPFDASYDSLRFDQPRFTSRGKVNLRHVARDHSFRSEADARQKHLHLFRGGILRLIQNDKRIPKRPAAHECQRRDFDHALFNELCDALVIDQIKERVVK